MASPPANEPPAKPKRRRRPKFDVWAKDADRPVPYNPLDLDHLGESVERRLLQERPVPLVEVPKTIGPGVYALYYTGDHELYKPISSKNCVRPIYVGKAVPQGGRKGLVNASQETSALWDRLVDHRYSLEEARDLDPNDFLVRYLVAVEVFVPLAERVMIQQMRPVWNIIVDGFGNNDPGAGRRTQARPPWDDLHPGRWWSHPAIMAKPSRYSQKDSRLRVQAFLAGTPVTVEPNDVAMADDTSTEPMLFDN